MELIYPSAIQETLFGATMCQAHMSAGHRAGEATERRGRVPTKTSQGHCMWGLCRH